MESIIFFNSHNYIYGSFCGNMQKNKQRKSKMKQYINNLKDYAELAQASYFYFDLFKDSQGIPRNIYELDSNNNKIKDESYPRGYKEMEVTLEHIVSQKHKEQEVLVNFEKGDDIFTKMRNDANESFNFDKLNGEFGEIQAQKLRDIRLNSISPILSVDSLLRYFMI